MNPSSSRQDDSGSTLSTRQTRLIRAVLLLLFLANGLYGLVQNSGVCDELGAHIPSGYLYLKSGEFSGGLDNLPLGQILIALPVKLLGLDYELFTEQHLLLFRLPVLLMGLLLAQLLYVFTRRLHGQLAALAALFLYCLSPNILAHATLATLDLPVSFFVFLAIFLLHRYVDQPGLRRLIWFGIALGAALLVKVQALLLLPFTAIACLVFWQELVPRGNTRRVSLLARWLLVPLLAMVMVNFAYLHAPFRDGGLLPAQFLEDIRGKLLHGARGQFSYLLGEYSTEGWWYYFPVAMFFKTPVPTLLLLALGLLARPTRRTAVLVLAPVALFLGAAMASKLNIGLRHVLIVYPFCFILAGRGAARLWGATWQRILLAVLAVWYAAGALLITPHHLSYFNVLAGGASNGHRYLVDANYDWGQNDRHLRRYLDAVDRAYKINPPAFEPTTGHILVNANALYGILNGGEKAYAWLKDREPVRQVAYTWFEYDVPAGSFPEQRRDDTGRRTMLAALYDLREDAERVEETRLRLNVAHLAAALHAYDLALAEVRAILARDPAYEPALILGGRLIVRHKLGVLLFAGDEYLTGFRTSAPEVDSAPSAEQVVATARSLGIHQRLSQVYAELGLALARRGEVGRASAALDKALLFDPANRPAQQYRQQLRRGDAGQGVREGAESHQQGGS